MDGTILCQGSFVSSGASSGAARVEQANPVVVVIPSNVDWMKVYNYTEFGINGTSAAYFGGVNNAFIGIEFYWQRGMAAGTGLVSYKSNGASTLNSDTLVSGGFTLYDPSGQSAGALPLLGGAVATTASTNATQPVVSTGNTAGLSVGSVVRMSNTAQTDVNGIDMVVGAVVNGTSFTLLTATNALANVPGAIGGAGFYRQVNFNPLFYPSKRFVVNITQAVVPQVSTSVAHGYVAGQAVRFHIPSQSGMTQLNSTQANNFATVTVVQVIDDYNFTINVNTSAFTSFTWPTIAQQPSQFPQVEPVGEDTASALLSPYAQTPSIGGQQIYNTNTGILSDATVNTGFLGMVLGAGGNGSALGTPILGPSGDVITTGGGAVLFTTMYWVAGKSTLGGL